MVMLIVDDIKGNVDHVDDAKDGDVVGDSMLIGLAVHCWQV